MVTGVPDCTCRGLGCGTNGAEVSVGWGFNSGVGVLVGADETDVGEASIAAGVPEPVFARPVPPGPGVSVRLNENDVGVGAMPGILQARASPAISNKTIDSLKKFLFNIYHPLLI